MEKVSKKQSINSKVFSIEKINPFFSKVKIYVLYAGSNRNGFYLGKDSIEKAIPTLYNTPIVGEFLEEEQNFGDHGASVTKNERGEYKMVLSTRPYGVIPESAQVYWEMVTESDGSEREYLVIDGAFLWSSRYPELQTFLDEGHYGQSMEIEIVNGNQAIRNGEALFEVHDFIFTGFCLLGISKDTDMFGHIEPAFEKAKVELVTYSLDKDSFKNQFNQMMNELKFSLQEGETKKLEDINVQDEIAKRLDTGVPSDAEPETVEPVTIADEDGQEPTPETPQEPQEPVVDDGEPIVDSTDDDGGDGAGVVTDGDDAGDDSGATFTVSEEEYTALQANFSTLEAEIEELREYKRGRELGDLKSQFSNQVSDKELQAIFEANSETSIEKLELEIFAIIGKKNFSLETKQEQNKVSVVSPKVASKEVNPYGDIFN